MSQPRGRTSSASRGNYDRRVGDFDALRSRRCECGAEDCTAEILISWEEQDAIDHSGDDLWILAPGHELRGARGAVTITRNDRYSVIRAIGHA